MGGVARHKRNSEERNRHVAFPSAAIDRASHRMLLSPPEYSTQAEASRRGDGEEGMSAHADWRILRAPPMRAAVELLMLLLLLSGTIPACDGGNLSNGKPLTWGQSLPYLGYVR